ncbi:unnamed protein product [Taenia asiatica]|uniref:Zf-AD domain-containing protein n=1 Tax=Taenia asiatica TaxID=60517 RepID=A0A0R3W5K3_TAEAS|nr:unnamed protein product [Taenia asiatica]
MVSGFRYMGKNTKADGLASPVHRQIDILYRQAYSCVYPLLDASSDFERQMSHFICRRCVNQMLHLAKKSRVRLSPVMRRSICRGCHLILDPRTTGRLRFHKTGIVVTCDACGTQNRTPLQPNAPYRPAYFERMLPDSKLLAIEINDNKPS